jgi:hypothetical protein
LGRPEAGIRDSKCNGLFSLSLVLNGTESNLLLV